MSNSLKLYIVGFMILVSFFASAGDKQNLPETDHSTLKAQEISQSLENSKDRDADLKHPLPSPLTSLVHTLLSPEDLEL